MAEIVFGFGTSHSPQLALLPEEWEIRARADRANPEHPFRDGVYSFPELAALRKDEHIERELTLEVRTDKVRRCNAALDRLGQVVDEVDPDVLVIIGDDQRDWFMEDIQPAFAVYFGPEIVNRAPAPQKLAAAEPGMKRIMLGYTPEQDIAYPVPVDLATAIIERAMADGFDVAVSSRERPGHEGGISGHDGSAPVGMGHAYGFVYRRVLRNRQVPVVPVFLNTYYPPNQPRPRRCWEFGRTIARAIKAWDGNKRVAVAASGGLTHFAIDEVFDRKVLDALAKQDIDALDAIPSAHYQSGTSEIKNWIATAGALAEAGLDDMTLIDYVPCYRSEAGTGTAMGFATWS